MGKDVSLIVEFKNDKVLLPKIDPDSGHKTSFVNQKVQFLREDKLCVGIVSDYNREYFQIVERKKKTPSPGTASYQIYELLLEGELSKYAIAKKLCTYRSAVDRVYKKYIQD